MMQSKEVLWLAFGFQCKYYQYLSLLPDMQLEPKVYVHGELQSPVRPGAIYLHCGVTSIEA